MRGEAQPAYTTARLPRKAGGSTPANAGVNAQVGSVQIGNDQRTPPQRREHGWDGSLGVLLQTRGGRAGLTWPTRVRDHRRYCRAKMSGTRRPKPDGRGEWRGGALYDQLEVFERYQEHRQWSLNPNVVMEEPALMAELGSVSGLRVLDLGCGDAALGRDFLLAGAARYLGVDGSERMVRAARETLDGTDGEVVHGDIEDFSAPPASFDLVVSRMAFHYIVDLRAVLRACHYCLVAGGRIVFTVVHPVITSHDPRASSTERRGSWVVDGYFVEGPREQPWLGTTTIWQHRTVESYTSQLRSSGFELAAVRECPPARERFDDEAEFERRRRIPLVLLLAGVGR